MGILVIEGSEQERQRLEIMLHDEGFTDVVLIDSVSAALDLLSGEANRPAVEVDLIILNILPSDVNGVEACRMLTSADHSRDIPIILVVPAIALGELDAAIEAGATDYVLSPIRAAALRARVRSALRLRGETVLRRAGEQKLQEMTQQLEAANQMLQTISPIDDLTGIANERHLKESLDREWKISLRSFRPLSLALVDIDSFNAFAETYGPDSRKDCLRQLAAALDKEMKRPGDVVARFAEDYFAVLLPDTNINGAIALAEYLRLSVDQLAIAHTESEVADHLTITLGLACSFPTIQRQPSDLIAAAGLALSQAIEEGRNRVKGIMMQ
ncbi:MAG: diguanylate cyclase [Deltaproteobacteria bacterium]|nr:diguanylate cyclase [Deltaproteobacteria bacterium]